MSKNTITKPWGAPDVAPTRQDDARYFALVMTMALHCSERAQAAALDRLVDATMQAHAAGEVTS